MPSFCVTALVLVSEPLFAGSAATKVLQTCVILPDVGMSFRRGCYLVSEMGCVGALSSLVQRPQLPPCACAVPGYVTFQFVTQVITQARNVMTG